MVKRFLTLMILVALLLSGCDRARPSPGWPVVSQITVTSRHNGIENLQSYTSQNKMRQILNCLRDLGQVFTPSVDPEALTARTFSVAVRFTDGSSRLYETKADLYIRFNGGPWQQADPKKLERLNLLLQNLPGDS